MLGRNPFRIDLPLVLGRNPFRIDLHDVVGCAVLVMVMLLVWFVLVLVMRRGTRRSCFLDLSALLKRD